MGAEAVLVLLRHSVNEGMSSMAAARVRRLVVVVAVRETAELSAGWMEVRKYESASGERVERDRKRSVSRVNVSQVSLTDSESESVM